MQIYFLLTENCNLNCSMCIRGNQQGNNINIEDLKKIIKNNNFQEHDVVITGGEPTIHKNFVEIIELFSKNSKTITITSNGTLNLHINELCNIKNLYYQISLDGSRDMHNKIRGKDTFEKAIKNIKELDFIKAKYSIASVVSKKNINEIFNLLPILENLNALQYWRISYEMPFGTASKIDNILTAKEWNDFVDNMLYRAKLKLKIKKIFPFELYERNFELLQTNILKRNRVVNCGSGLNKIYVYPNFEVYPCTCLTDFNIGNLKIQNLHEILEGKKIKQFTEYKINDNSQCIDCKYKDYCNGGCIGMSYHYFGELGMGDLRCPKIAK